MRCQPCSCPRYYVRPTWVSNSRAQQWPTWVTDSSLEQDLKLDPLNMGWYLEIGYFIYLCPRLYGDFSLWQPMNTASSHCDTVITYFPLFLFSYQKSILYLPVCFCVYQWFPNSMTTTVYTSHSGVLAWRPEPAGLQSTGSLRVGHNWATSLSLFTCMHWRRKWQPTPVFLPGESQGRGSLLGCRLWGCTESDTTEVT